MTLHDIDLHTDLQAKARDHLWMHFARQSVMTEGPGVPIIVKGDPILKMLFKVSAPYLSNINR